MVGKLTSPKSRASRRASRRAPKRKSKRGPKPKSKRRGSRRASRRVSKPRSKRKSSRASERSRSISRMKKLLAVSVYRAHMAKRAEREINKRIKGGCWRGYERVPGTKQFSKGSCRKSRRSLRAGSGDRCSPGKNKKFAKVVNGKCVRFGDPNMTIKKNKPGRRRSFCARHRCSTKSNKATPGYQSCKKWNCSTVA